MILRPQDLGVHTSSPHGYQEVALYCPYWMINKTGRELTYKVRTCQRLYISRQQELVFATMLWLADAARLVM